MSSDFNLRLIRDKIYEMRSAIMYNLSDEVIRLPNCIINVVKVDDEGQLWFMYDKPLYRAEQYPGLFPARLQFYRKGISYHLEISGPAEIANQFQHDSEPVGNRWLIKMKMKNITYTEAREKASVDLMHWVHRSYRYLAAHLSMPRHAKPLPGH